MLSGLFKAVVMCYILFSNEFLWQKSILGTTKSALYCMNKGYKQHDFRVIA